jgi:hypothetical protein
VIRVTEPIEIAPGVVLCELEPGEVPRALERPIIIPAEGPCGLDPSLYRVEPDEIEEDPC